MFGVVDERQASHRDSFRYCDADCAAQAALPELNTEALADFTAFTAARNKVTCLHANGKLTLQAIAMLTPLATGECERDWYRAFKYGYKNQKNTRLEPVYSVLYYKDPGLD